LPTEIRDDASSARPITIGRLKRRSEFLRVAGIRCKWATPGLILQAAPAPEESPPLSLAINEAGRVSSRDVAPFALRVGFTCSKKVGNAVARNRAKRRLRAAAAAILPTHAAPGYDYVLIGRQETLRRPYALLLQDLQTALKRVCANRNGNRAERPPQARQSGQEAS
jgi:ribonuclease P protein component